MKTRLSLFVSLLFISVAALAQDNPPSKSKDVEGEVKVYQDEAIKNLIGAPRSQSATQGGGSDTATSGDNSSKATPSDGKSGSYRILVYSGNDQKKSKQEAFSRRNQIKGRFADMSVDVYYDSPMWKVRAGRYASKSDAESALHALKNAFPSFGKEMYIVKVAASKHN